MDLAKKLPLLKKALARVVSMTNMVTTANLSQWEDITVVKNGSNGKFGKYGKYGKPKYKVVCHVT